MNICLIGQGLTNLIFAKVLANKNINVSLFLDSKKAQKSPSRSIAISKNNFDFINNQIKNIKKICWPIKNIKIYNENNQNEDLLNFDKFGKELFLVVEYDKIKEFFLKKIKKNKLIKIKKIKNQQFYNSILEKNRFDIIINSDGNNGISKFFFNKIVRDYKSTAFTTIIDHKKFNNNQAIQIFTKFGPLAFLPISNSKTSIIFSLYKERLIKNDESIKKLIIKYNKIYRINNFSKFEKFNLKFFSLRKYYYKNILSFGDAIHRIHPLAGQGLNMTLRDIELLSDLIDKRIELGLPLDSSILKKFESKTKHLNYIFSSGINFIYDFFKFDNKFSKNYSKKMFIYLEKNKLFKKYATEFADRGIFL